MSRVFARRASGLVRQASLLDVAFANIAWGAVPVSTWYFISTQPVLYPGANYILVFIIGGFLAIFGYAMVWGILAGTMPRSGGDYIYNSRIIHPVYAMAESMALMLAFIFWNMLGCSYIIDPGIRILIGTTQAPFEAFQWMFEPLGLFIVATIINVIAFLVATIGLKVFLWIQRVLITIAIIGVILASLVLTITPHTVFVSTWNYYASQLNIPTWDILLSSVESSFSIPQTWNWLSTMGSILPLGWSLLYIGAFPYLGGEAKNPRISLFWGSAIAAVVTLLFVAWPMFAYLNLVGWNGVHVLSYVEIMGIENYTLPYPPMFLIIASMLTHFNPVIGYILGFSFIFILFLWLPIIYLAFSRVLFAWGMDRVAPTWFTDVSPRFHCPVKLNLLFLILTEIALVIYAINPTILAGYSVEFAELVTLFLFISISCAVLPYRKKIKHIWETSPYKTWKIGPIPYATIAGILSIVFVAICVWGEFYGLGLGAISILGISMFLGGMIFGVIWYFIWKWYRMKEGVDIVLAFKELAPE